jgi:hypothetical protein
MRCRKANKHQKKNINATKQRKKSKNKVNVEKDKDNFQRITVSVNETRSCAKLCLFNGIQLKTCVTKCSDIVLSVWVCPNPQVTSSAKAVSFICIWRKGYWDPLWLLKPYENEIQKLNTKI